MRRDLWVGLLLAIVTLAVYWPVGTHDFILYDDPQFITENPQIQSGLSWGTIKYAFTEPVVGNWHPVTTLSHAIDCQLFGVKAGAHHLVNALIHALNTALLFFLLQQVFRCIGGKQTRIADAAAAENALRAPARVKKATRGGAPHSELGGTWLSAVLALLFALHPLRVESVAWLAERKDVLSGLFFLLSLWFYLGFVQNRGELKSEKRQSVTKSEKRESALKSGKRESGKAETPKGGSQAIAYYYAASLVCFALGLMSKPMVVTLPFVLLLLDFWPAGRFRISNLKSQIPKLRGLILEKFPFFMLAAIDCFVTLRVQKSAGAMQLIEKISWSERVGNAVTSYVRYLGKFFWPTNLSIVYPHPARRYYLSEAWPGWEVGCAALLLVFITVFCVLQARRRPYLLVGWLWFLGTLIPVIGLVQVGEQAMADRYTYTPLIGVLIMLVGLACDQRKEDLSWTTTSVTASVVTLAALTVVTRHQLDYWKDTVTLFEHAVAVTADNPSAQFALGSGLEKQGEVGKAMVRYRVAVAIDPHYGKAYYNMGQLLRKGEYWPQAVEAYSAAANCSPNDLPTQLNLAAALARVGRNREAIDHFDRALELDPRSLEALNNLAWLLATNPDPQIRNGTRAVDLAEQGCALTESKAAFLLGTLAAAYAEAGRFGDAVVAGEKAFARATEIGDSAGAAKNKELVELYRANRPYRDSQ